MKVLVSGGFCKKGGNIANTGARFECGYLQRVDWETGEIENELLYETPGTNSNTEFGTIFKAFHVAGKCIYVPTSTEIVLVDSDRFDVRDVVSHPLMNDIHHVFYKDGDMHVVNTGLDNMLVFSEDGLFKEEIPLASGEIKRRFGDGIDYRYIQSTKPHEVHANYLFYVGDEPWVTRLINKDAVSLRDNTRRINLDVTEGAPHDGIVAGDFIYFTLTNGCVAVVNVSTLKVEYMLDLNQLYGSGTQLGWCRGIAVEAERILVGFTIFRYSRFREYGRWIKSGARPQPARVVEFDLGNKSVKREHKLVSRDRKYRNGCAAVFSIGIADTR